jgi:glycosyltransferase involved in cell wall biosynthesis
MQEADAMIGLGIDVSIACNSINVERLRQGYRDLPRIQAHIQGFANPAELGKLIGDTKRDVVIATTNQSVHTLAEALETMPQDHNLRFGYYIQDYEPLFYDKSSEDWAKAYTSFGLIPGMVHFAKTSWLQEVTNLNHNVPVQKVLASIDHTVYYPDLAYRTAPRDKVTVAAMVRPATPRRAPRRTVRILNRLAAEHGDTVSCLAFGCQPEELASEDLRLAGVENVGVLGRRGVGDLFRKVDLFLDLSDYQAFGRTAIEAMSCGVISVVPVHGGAHEFAVHGTNSFVVDVRSDDDIMNAVSIFLSMTAADRTRMARMAINAGYKYTPELAALSEIELFL